MRPGGSLVGMGADDVKSRARLPGIGYGDKASASGYALYRTFFNAKDDSFASCLSRQCDARTGWIGPDIHAIWATIKKGEGVQLGLNTQR